MFHRSAQLHKIESTILCSRPRQLKIWPRYRPADGSTSPPCGWHLPTPRWLHSPRYVVALPGELAAKLRHQRCCSFVRCDQKRAALLRTSQATAATDKKTVSANTASSFRRNIIALLFPPASGFTGCHGMVCMISHHGLCRCAFIVGIAAPGWSVERSSTPGQPAHCSYHPLTANCSYKLQRLNDLLDNWLLLWKNSAYQPRPRPQRNGQWPVDETNCWPLATD